MSAATIFKPGDFIVAASATWQDEKTLLLTWRFIETVHGGQLTCIFDEDHLAIKFLFSVNRLQNKPDDRADVTGKMMAQDFSYGQSIK